MMRIRIVCVGSLKEDYWRNAAAEYCKRLGAFCRVEVVEADEARVPENPSRAQLDAAIALEGKRILEKALPHSEVWPLCIEGKPESSEQFARRIAQAGVAGTSAITFVIGGSWGLSDEVKSRGSYKLSFSPMTFPHQLARIMLLEQLYRAFSINTNGKYHK